MLKSLVIPLEEKIQELTNKLQTAELKLKKYEPDLPLTNVGNFERNRLEKTSSELSHNTSQESGSCSPKRLPSKNSLDEEGNSTKLDEEDNPSEFNSLKSPPCNMCNNYETQLVAQQKLYSSLQKDKEKIEANMEKLKEDFLKETQFRKTMEDKWNEKKEKHKTKVGLLYFIKLSIKNSFYFDYKFTRKQKLHC